jgi:phosphopantothenoylcysteine decarboxylase/phosphopantothenate--cysteine ligase
MIAPAMNTHMFANVTVQENLAVLRERGMIQVGPEVGEMAAPGETPGLGRMSEPDEIVDSVQAHFDDPDRGVLSGKHILITAGRTEERLDDVRMLTNRSSGRMGVELARTARRMGARVILVHGAMDVEVPEGIESVRIESTIDLLEAVQARIRQVDVAIYAAAVSDWRPKNAVSGKLKKSDGKPPAVEMVENPDVAAETAKNCGGFTLGFALESSEDLDAARGKLKNKNLDAILLNTSSAIGAAESQVAWIEQGAEPVRSPEVSKAELADWIFSRLVERIFE